MTHPHYHYHHSNHIIHYVRGREVYHIQLQVLFSTYNWCNHQFLLVINYQSWVQKFATFFYLFYGNTNVMVSDWVLREGHNQGFECNISVMVSYNFFL